MTWLWKLIAPRLGRLLELGTAAITAGAVFYFLFKREKSPDRRYYNAMDTIIKRWQKDIDSFAAGVANENMDKITTHLADYERRKLMRTLEERADGADEAEGETPKEE